MVRPAEPAWHGQEVKYAVPVYVVVDADHVEEALTKAREALTDAWQVDVWRIGPAVTVE
jgi:hypothetical protein